MPNAERIPREASTIRRIPDGRAPHTLIISSRLNPSQQPDSLEAMLKPVKPRAPAKCCKSLMDLGSEVPCDAAGNVVAD